MGLLSKLAWWKSSSVSPLGTEVYDWSVEPYGEFKSDPLVIRRGLLLATHGRCWEWASQARAFELELDACADGEGEEFAAKRAEFSMRLADLEGKLAEAAFQAFGLPRIDRETGNGVGEAVALSLVQGFLGWCEEKKEPPEE